MMIQAVLGNPYHPEYGVATIPFPIPHDQYAHCMELLEALEIGDAVKADCQVQEINSFYSVLKRMEMLTVNVEELNYLAKRLDSFDTGEAAQFQAVAHKLELFQLKDLINLTFCCQQATVITDFSDLSAVGRPPMSACGWRTASFPTRWMSCWIWSTKPSPTSTNWQRQRMGCQMRIWKSWAPWSCWQSQSQRRRSKTLRKASTSLTSLPVHIRRRKLRRKQSEYEGEACSVDKVIELPAQRFQQFSHALLADYDFIAENKNAIRHDEDARHCLLILDAEGKDGFLVDPQGYNYARYSAFVPNSRSLLTPDMAIDRSYLSPAEPWRDESRDEILRMTLRVNGKPDYTLVLPSDEEYLDAVKNYLDIDVFADARLCDIRFKVPYIGELIRDTDCPAVEDYNDFAEALEDIWQKDGMLLTYAAVLEAEKPETLRGACELLRNLDNYQRITEGAYGYGQQRLQETLGLDDEAIYELDGYMDFEKYGQDCMENDCVTKTEFSLLRRLDPPFPEQTQGQQMFQ